MSRARWSQIGKAHDAPIMATTVAGGGSVTRQLVATSSRRAIGVALDVGQRYVAWGVVGKIPAPRSARVVSRFVAAGPSAGTEIRGYAFRTFAEAAAAHRAALEGLRLGDAVEAVYDYEEGYLPILGDLAKAWAGTSFTPACDLVDAIRTMVLAEAGVR